MKGFGHSVRVVTAVHVVVVLGLFTFSGCRMLLHRKPEHTIPIAFTVEVPAEPAADPVDDPVDDAVEHAPPPPVPIPDPIPDPIAVPDKVAPRRDPAPTKPPRKIDTSSKRVTRDSATKRESRLTQAEIERLLAEGALPSDSTQIPDADARGFARVRAAFYEVWVQPSRTEVGDRSAEAIIVLGTGGLVISGRLSRPSGNAVLDNSVSRALNAVKQVSGLPSGFVERHREISVAFRLE